MDATYSPNTDTLERYSLDIVSRSARDLTLIRAIEQTLDALRYDQGNLEADCKFAIEFAERIQTITPQKVIDPTGRVDDSLVRAQDAIKSNYLALIEKRDRARDDRNLEISDGIEEAFSNTIAAAAGLYNAIGDLRWTIGEHDAELSEKIAVPVCRSKEEVRTVLA